MNNKTYRQLKHGKIFNVNFQSAAFLKPCQSCRRWNTALLIILMCNHSDVITQVI